MRNTKLTVLRIPTGFRPKARGCEARATLGHRPTNLPNRNAVAAHPLPAPDVADEAVFALDRAAVRGEVSKTEGQELQRLLATGFVRLVVTRQGNTVPTKSGSSSLRSQFDIHYQMLTPPNAGAVGK